MAQIMAIIQWLGEHSAIILGALFALSEALSLVPGIKANGVFQLIYGWLKKQKDAAPKV